AAVVDFIIAPKLRTNDDGRVPAEVCVILHPIKDFAHFQIGCSYDPQVFFVTAVSHIVVSFSADDDTRFVCPHNGRHGSDRSDDLEPGVQVIEDIRICRRAVIKPFLSCEQLPESSVMGRDSLAMVFLKDKTLTRYFPDIRTQGVVRGVDRTTVITRLDMAPTLAWLFGVKALYAAGRVMPGLFKMGHCGALP